MHAYIYISSGIPVNRHGRDRKAQLLKLLTASSSPFLASRRHLMGGIRTYVRLLLFSCENSTHTHPAPFETAARDIFCPFPLSCTQHTRATPRQGASEDIDPHLQRQRALPYTNVRCANSRSPLHHQRSIQGQPLRMICRSNDKHALPYKGEMGAKPSVLARTRKTHVNCMR